MILSHINDIAAVCAGHGIKTAVISPGSRSAPLTLAFDQHPGIDVKVIGDERSAAFIALGIAQQQRKTVVLICTSGSAVYNYAPAIAEAYYQEIPLMVLSADRPPEWTNQYDGQTIQQSGIFGKHVKGTYDLPVDVSHKDAMWHSNRTINEAINLSESAPHGPVHINVPLREPFYPGMGEKITFGQVRLIRQVDSAQTITENRWQELVQLWGAYQKRLIVIGQSEMDADLSKSLNSLAVKTGTPVITDIISNQQSLPDAIVNQDAILQSGRLEALARFSPELLITVGKSLISKNLKLFLRKFPPKSHWHIHHSDRINDTLQNLTHWVQIPANAFFSRLEKSVNSSVTSNFTNNWQATDGEAGSIVSKFIENTDFGEFQACYYCLKALPDNSQLHLANSMAVRYANLIGLKDKKNVMVFANRGTSGIDGSNGTAVGATLAQQSLVTLLTGDMAFFYDRNAFWHNYNLSNLRIILLNNHGGGIFRMINGPTNQPSYEKLFETEQPLNAENTAKDHGFEYYSCNDLDELKTHLKNFYTTGEKPKILEVFSDSKENARIMKSFKEMFTS